MKHSAENKKAEVERRQNRIALLLLAAILLYIASYEMLFAEGPSYLGDDTMYVYYATQFVRGNFVETANVFSLRILNTFPIAVFYFLFGIGKLTTAGWSIVSFLGTAIVAFYLGKELYNNYVGLVSALLLAFFPLFVVFSGTPSPNIPEAFLTGLAFLALLRGRRRNSREWYFVGGAAMVASILATPASGIIFFVIAAYLLLELAKKKLKVDGTSICLLYGIAVALSVLLAYNYATTGNPFITFTAAAEVYSTAGTTVENILINTDPGFYFSVMFPYHILQSLGNALASGNLNPLSLWQSIYVINYDFSGFYFYAVVLCAAYLLVARERKAYVPLLWLAAGFLYLELGPIYLSIIPFKYLLTHRLERYLTIIGIPSVVIISMAMVRIAERCRRSKHGLLIVAPALAVIFLVVTALPINLMWHSIITYETFDQMSIASYLSALPSSTRVYVLADFPMVEAYMGYSNTSRFSSFRDMSCTEVPQGAYVAIPKLQIYNISYTPDPSSECPGWQLALNPQINGTYPDYITNMAPRVGLKLYHVPAG